MTTVTNKKTVKDIDLKGKTVLVRVDYNVPFHPNTTHISDDSRIKASLPTIKYLIGQKCKVILCTHLGRPDGKISRTLTVAPIVKRLEELLAKQVLFVSECIGSEVKMRIEEINQGDILMLENVRFHPGEESNDPRFASELASLAEIYVNDAFGCSHRYHASTVGVTKYLPAVSGLLMSDEIIMLGDTLKSPRRPFAAILGGAKTSDKLGLLEKLISSVNILIIGGGMAATFLKAKGLEVGESLIELDYLPFATNILNNIDSHEVNLILPVDVVVAESFEETTPHRTVNVTNIMPNSRIMDIGPQTIHLISKSLNPCKTVLWNGPMGIFEWHSFSHGTNSVANILSGLKQATTVVGGGSTAESTGKLGLTKAMTHVSTGGGASLQFLEGRGLPGIKALLDK